MAARGNVKPLLTLYDLSMIARKRFYKDVSVVHEGRAGLYEICLDGKKLKTPLGKPFKVN